MLPATEDHVRADFGGTVLHSDRDSLFFLDSGALSSGNPGSNIPGRDAQFQVRTGTGSDNTGTFDVAYTFGWEPLQQYLVALDDGRLQALGAAWDTQQQRWFHLYDNLGVDAAHPLHWRQPAQNANTQCIECHTSHYQLGYEAATDRFDSQWHSLGVGCQACHGPASEHVRWAQAPNTHPGKGFAAAPASRTQQPDTCGRCHSRRTPLGDPTGHTKLHDAFLVSPLSADLYEVDGKIKDEVFEYGSFLQSKMHQAGVVCSDCHNPHSGQLRAPDNAVCTQCHNTTGTATHPSIRTEHLRPAHYDSAAHHHHQPGSAGAACRACHMPGKFYMGNDLRHDHSFSSPDPAQAQALGHSDACLGCHREQSPEALITAFQQWYPEHQPRDGGYARALFKAREGKPGAADALASQLARNDLPAPRRAALVAELPRYPSDTAQALLRDALIHDDASVRRAAIEASAALAPPLLQQHLPTLLNDTVRSVRLAAAEQWLLLADQQGMVLPAEPFEEYEQVQQQLLANAEAHFSLANLYRLTGRSERVEAALATAVERNPHFSPAVIGLAQWREQAGDAAAALQLLRQRLHTHPGDASLHHALGLALIRNGQLAAGITELEKAHSLAPENDTHAWVLAVAWHDTGQRERALQLLRDQLQHRPANRSLRLALLGYLPAGEERHQLLHALAQQNPQDPVVLYHRQDRGDTTWPDAP